MVTQKRQLEKDLLPIKAHYFLFNAGTAPVVPFMPTLAKQMGFSSFVVGTVYAILPILGILAKPFFGFIADRYQRHRMLLISAEILTALAFFLIMFTPTTPKAEVNVELHCHSDRLELAYCYYINECIAGSLKKHYKDHGITCQLDCQMQQAKWNIVCEYWLQEKPRCYTLSEHYDNLTLTTFLNMHNLIYQNSCIHIHVPHASVDILNHNLTTYCPANETSFNVECALNCQDEYLTSIFTPNYIIPNADAMHLYQFWWFFIMLALSWIGMAVVVSVGDAMCLSLLADRSHLYGKQRLFGSLGWGIFSILAGILVDKMSNGVEKNYDIVFWMTAVILSLDVFSSYKLKHTQAHISKNILKDIGQMILSIRCVVFFIWCILIGLGTALIWNFLFWHLETLNHCPKSMKTLQGVIMAIQCFCGELPLFFFSGWIIKKIGHINAMSLVLFGFGIRFICYSMLENPWHVLPIELLNGITFGLFYAVMASYANVVAPPGTETTMQGLVGAIFEGIGVSSGSFIGGLLFKTVGGGHTFGIYGIAAFIAFLLHVCIQSMLKRLSRNENNSSLNGIQGNN